MTRTGKIARLPRQIRHDLNQRLQDNALGKDLVDWLNTLPETQQLLSAEFEGRPINEQNLSDWRQGGFRDWLRQQEARERLDRFVEFSDGLEDPDDEQNISERLARILAAELAAETQQLLEDATDPKERFRFLCEALRQLHALRRSDRAAARTARENKAFELAAEDAELAAIEADHQASVRDMKHRATSHIWDSYYRLSLAKVFGDGPEAKAAAEQIIDLGRIFREEEPLPPMPPDPPAEPPPANQP
jgi:hypothetical protein